MPARSSRSAGGSRRRGTKGTKGSSQESEPIAEEPEDIDTPTAKEVDADANRVGDKDMRGERATGKRKNDGAEGGEEGGRGKQMKVEVADEAEEGSQREASKSRDDAQVKVQVKDGAEKDINVTSTEDAENDAKIFDSIRTRIDARMKVLRDEIEAVYAAQEREFETQAKGSHLGKAAKETPRLRDMSIDKEVKAHIEALHRYNHYKDVGQGLLGRIAEKRGVTTRSLYPEFGLSVDD